MIDLSGAVRSTTSVAGTVSPKKVLLDQERAALHSAICPDSLKKHGWTINEQTGAINKGPLNIFSPGFVTGLSKILGDTEV